jgi:hypothetical protein
VLLFVTVGRGLKKGGCGKCGGSYGKRYGLWLNAKY